MPQPFELLDSVVTAEGPLQLLRRGASDYMITVGGKVLMSSAITSTELLLAEDSCRAVAAVPRPRVLIGGLGLGYTLRAALDSLPFNALVTVAELNSTVVKWCQGLAADASGRAALDRRVKVVVADVVEHLQQVSQRPNEPRYDAVIWDLYEGPTRRAPDDDPLYGVEALTATHAALNDGGVLAVWGEQLSPAFEKRLKKLSYVVRSVESGSRGTRHAIYLATKRALRPAKRTSEGALEPPRGPRRRRSKRR